jgi:hypothetical protein
VKLAHNVIEKVTNPYIPVHNPTLSKHFAYLKAVALQSDVISDFKDETIPDYNYILAAAGEQILEFNHAIHAKVPVIFDGKSTKLKRKKTEEGAAPKTKKAKPDDHLDPAVVKQAISAGTLKSYTVPELKTILQTAGQKIKGSKKSDLLDAVSNFYS